MSRKDDFIRSLMNLGGEVHVIGGDDEARDTSSDTPVDRAMQARVLRDILPDVHRPCPFQIGDLVEQIDSYRSYRFPPKGAIAIVTQLFQVNPLEAHKERTRPGQSNREDMVILTMAEGTWVEFTVESWRFKAYDGDVA